MTDPTATIYTPGVVLLAPNGGTSPNTAVQGNDTRLKQTQSGSVVLGPVGLLKTSIALSPVATNTSYSVTCTPVTTFVLSAIGTRRLTSFDILLEYNGGNQRVNWQMFP